MEQAWKSQCEEAAVFAIQVGVSVGSLDIIINLSGIFSMLARCFHDCIVCADISYVVLFCIYAHIKKDCDFADNVAIFFVTS